LTYGYAGRILWVDLTSKKAVARDLDYSLARNYIGGTGVATKILYDYTGPHTDPLGPENHLIFMTGPFTGTKVPLSGRHHVVARSPLTNIYGESDVGGVWGAGLKRAGYDGLVVYGSSDKPIYLWVNESAVGFRDASGLWGLDTYDTYDAIRGETDGKASVCCIGQAGEKLARISSIMSEGRDGRAAGRCGLGAVMGSKRLKAIAVKGDREISVADPDELEQSIKEFGAVLVKRGARFRDYGTSGGVPEIHHIGDLPVKNWMLGSFEGAEEISGQRMAETVLSGKYYCYSCILGCGRKVRVEDGRYSPVEGAGPEYETVAMLGANVLVDNLKAICKANELCNRYGLDTISTGAVIAFAIEARERGLISGAEAEKLRWGDPDSIIEMIHKIGGREGLGWILGEGVKRAAESIGGLALEFALHVKGLELPAHDPRAHNSVGLGYATASRGACHNQACSHIYERVCILPELGYPEVQDRFGVKGKGVFVAKLQDYMALFDSLKLCKFLVIGNVQPSHIRRWLKCVTGWDMEVDGLMKIGERISNLKRLYNVKLGLSRIRDTLPPRILTLRKGGGAGQNLPPLNEMLAEYYEYRGWDEFGIPTYNRLKMLGLEDEAAKTGISVRGLEQRLSAAPK
jgi:aldehyde:ferredoxin oxidoreductase